MPGVGVAVGVAVRVAVRVAAAVAVAVGVAVAVAVAVGVALTVAVAVAVAVGVAVAVALAVAVVVAVEVAVAVAVAVGVGTPPIALSTKVKSNPAISTAVAPWLAVKVPVADVELSRFQPTISDQPLYVPSPNLASIFTSRESMPVCGVFGAIDDNGPTEPLVPLSASKAVTSTSGA
jgi:hypothetical protein